jgi:2-haloacid dehalogenase
MSDLANIKALTFDIFGTVVDWRGSIIREGQQWGQAHDLDINWTAFADAWRAGYEPTMARVNRGNLPWANIDAIHRMLLEDLLDRFGIRDLDEPTKDHWNRTWHRLKPWPDSLAGVARLRQHYTVASLSNGNVALLTNMAKNAGLQWDCILSAELFNCYKPDPRVYQGAAQLLGLEPHQVMMVAAHNHNVGLRTAFVLRATEYGPNQENDLAADPGVDISAADLNDLADKLLAHN